MWHSSFSRLRQDVRKVSTTRCCGCFVVQVSAAAAKVYAADSEKRSAASAIQGGGQADQKNRVPLIKLLFYREQLVSSRSADRR